MIGIQQNEQKHKAAGNRKRMTDSLGNFKLDWPCEVVS